MGMFSAYFPLLTKDTNALARKEPSFTEGLTAPQYIKRIFKELIKIITNYFIIQ